MLTENENQQQTNFIENQTKLVSLISSSSFLVSKLKNQENLIAPFNSLTILDIGLNMKYNDNLLSNKLIIPVLSKVTDQLSKLSSRISDTRSRVLVTGDLNAGKSTFINAILQRQIVPDDQQPCTAIFAEVIDANQNNCIEEVHGIMNPDLYMNENTDTFQRFEINQLREIVEVNENGFALLKVYCQDSREKTRSLLHNGIVDISLIDSPGLNIDSMKTTALFAQQDEIDVIVFVVNAENHFTLSGREFLNIAGREKAYIFIVINKFDNIQKRADRCRRDILDQIKEISPNTFADSDNLVHFVSAKQCLESAKTPTEFAKLEDDLRSFILEKRSRSKLLPAKLFLSNLMIDMKHIALYNSDNCSTEINQVMTKILSATPFYRRMLDLEFNLEDLEEKIDSSINEIKTTVNSKLSDFIDDIDVIADDVEWRGVLKSSSYIKSVQDLIQERAKLIVDSCNTIADKECLDIITFYTDLAEKCTDPIIIPDKSNLQFISNQENFGPVFKNVLDSNTRYELIQEFIPAVAFISIGVSGFQGMFHGLFSAGINSPVIWKLPKSAWFAVTVAGTGLFLYALSDVRTHILKKLIVKIKCHFNDNAFVQTHTDSIQKQSRRVLTNSLYDFSTRFSRALLVARQEIAGQEAFKEALEKRGKVYEGIAKECENIGFELNSLEI